MPKINREEYEVLKELDDSWKWIARDKDRGLYAFTEKPVRKYDPSPYWDTETEEDYSALELFDEIHLLQFIQWEDEEPYNIAELIKEYEEEPDLKEQMSVVMDRLEEVCGIAMKEVGRVFGGIGLESEEAEVKNKEWAIKEIEGLETESSQYYPHDEMIETEIVFSILDQLDEPEVLSHKWVSDNTVVGQYPNGMGYFVPTYKLKNLLVPKQEEVDQAYKDGYEKGKQHTFYKGYLEGLADKENEPETVASVIADFYKSFERLKEVMSMEVEELEG